MLYKAHRHSAILSREVCAHTPSPFPPETPASLSHMPLEESGASVSLLPALATSDPGQKDHSQSPPAVGSTSPRAQASNSPLCSSNPSSPLLSCTPSLSPLRPAPRSYQACETRAQAPKLEFKELQWSIKKQQLLPRTGAQELYSVWVSTVAGRETGQSVERGEG